jgi:hypothetical protein
MRARDALLFAVLLSVLLAALRLWPPIATRGEAREALVVRELAAGGDWVLPRRQGVIASKPPLYHWLAAVTVRLAGPSDAVMRLPSVGAAWALALETFGLGVLVGGRGMAWLAVGILFAAWGVWRSALEARVDMLFAACVVGAIGSIAWWALRDAARGRLLCWPAAAAAVLTKGPVGVVLPALVALAFFASGRDWMRLRRLWSWPAASLAALATGAWYAAAALTGGRAFLAVQLVRESIDRFLGRGDFAPTRSFAWLLMLRHFLGHLAPWNLAIVDDLRRWRHAGRGASPAGRFLHCWWLAVLALFTAAAGKRPVYLLPLYPAIALLAARALWRAAATRAARASIAGAVSVIALCTLVASRHDRLTEIERHGLVPLAHAVRAMVPPGAPLHASLGLSENDLLVLAYLVDRPLMRKRITCTEADASSYYLRPVPSRAAAMSLDRIASSGGVELVRCAPEIKNRVGCCKPLDSVQAPGLIVRRGARTVVSSLATCGRGRGVPLRRCSGVGVEFAVVRATEPVLRGGTSSRSRPVLRDAARRLSGRRRVPGERGVPQRDSMRPRSAADTTQRGADDRRRSRRLPLWDGERVPQRAQRHSHPAAGNAESRPARRLRHRVPDSARHGGVVLSVAEQHPHGAVSTQLERQPEPR